MGPAVEGEDAALGWAMSMLQVEPRRRPKPFEVFDRAVAESDRSRVLFYGTCCLGRSESAAEGEGGGESLGEWSDGDDEG